MMETLSLQLQLVIYKRGSTCSKRGKSLCYFAFVKKVLILQQKWTCQEISLRQNDCRTALQSCSSHMKHSNFCFSKILFRHVRQQH